MASREINEALLEMVFFEPLRSLMEGTFGRAALRIWKPSARRERFLGFDQAWLRASSPHAAIEADLMGALRQNATSLSGFYFGYFLQFKCVDAMSQVRNSSLRTSGFAKPWYRATLDMSASQGFNVSQHELLVRLNNIHGAHVYYACPIFVDRDEIYAPVDLDRLRLVPLSQAPSGYLTTGPEHHIAFRTPVDPAPMWLSDPVPGKSMTAPEWLKTQEVRLLSNAELLELLRSIVDVLDGTQQRSAWSEDGRSPFPSTLTIVEFSSESGVPERPPKPTRMQQLRM